MSRSSSTELAVLGALPTIGASSGWLTPVDVAKRLELDASVARSVLVRLRGRGLAEDDGERPQAFARTHRGDLALEDAE